MSTTRQRRRGRGAGGRISSHAASCGVGAVDVVADPQTSAARQAQSKRGDPPPQVVCCLAFAVSLVSPLAASPKAPWHSSPMRIPDKGLAKDEIFRRLEAFRADDMHWRSGRTWAYVYDPGAEAEEVIKQAYTMYLTENALDPTAFPSVLRLENEVVAHGRGAPQRRRGRGRQLHQRRHREHHPGGQGGARLRARAAAATSPSRRSSCRRRRTRRSTRRRTTSTCKPVLVPVDPTTFKADVDADARARSRRTRSCSSARRCRTRTASSIRSASSAQLALEREPAAPRRRLHGRLPAALLPPPRRAGARRSTSACPASPRSRWTSTSTPSPPRAPRSILYRNKELRRYQIYACAQLDRLHDHQSDGAEHASRAARWRPRGRC